MAAWWSLVAAVCFVVFVGTSHHPRDCLQADTPQGSEYECALPAGNLTIEIGVEDSYRYIKFICKSNGVLECRDLPEFTDPNLLPHAPLNSTFLKGCSLYNESLICILRKFSVTSVKSIYINDLPGGTAANLKPLHLMEIGNVTSLSLRDTYRTSVTPLPIAVISTLSSLRKFTIRGANIQLTTDMFIGVPELRYLEISECNISSVPAGAFRGLNSLSGLAIWGNKIQKIIPGIFHGLESLMQLDLSSNDINLVASDAFNGSRRLSAISLKSNSLERVEADAFGGLSSLKSIQMSNNRGQLQFDDTALASLPSLDTLYIDRAGVTLLPDRLLENTSALTTLSLAGNSLQDLPPNLLRDQKNLELLNLSENKIRFLSSGLFASLVNLKRLDLSGNSIEGLSGRVFAGLTNLRWMSLERNRLRVFSHKAFPIPAGSALHTLSLAHNALTLASASPGALLSTDDFGDLDFGSFSPFASLHHLTTLNLSWNRINTVFYDWKIDLLNLTTLDLSHNLFSILQDADINFLQKNITVDLRGNNITKISLRPMNSDELEGPKESHEASSARAIIDSTAIECSCELYGLTQRLHGGRPIVREIRLELSTALCAKPPSYRGISVASMVPDMLTCALPDAECAPLCSCVMRPATATLELNCTAPPILENFRALRSRGLISASLRLTKPPRSLLTLDPRVRLLNLSGLALTHVPPLPINISLQEIDLTNNALAYLPLELLDKRRVLFRIGGNQFACDCRHVRELDALQSHNERILDKSLVTCSGGGVPWTVPVRRLCDSWVVGGASGVLVLLGLLAVASAWVFHRYRVSIRVFLYGRGWCIRWFGEDEDDDKIFDIFLSFAHRDHRFVIDNLLPGLEGGRWPYRVCVHYRDWVVGEWVPAQIARSVAGSRRTLVVMSGAFLDSAWSRLEFRAAHECSLNDNRPRLLVVLLEDVIEDPRLDPDMRAYLSTNTYVRWGDARFWTKLYAALPPSRGSTEGCDNMKLKTGALNVWLTDDGKLLNYATTPPQPSAPTIVKAMS